MDGSYWDYAYNAKGEVTGAVKKNASGTPFPGLQYGYSFDEIGNRVSASVDAAVSGTRNTTYTSNALNQYTSIGTPNAFDVIGSAASSAIVKVNTETADRLGPYFRKEVTVNNSASAVWKGLNLEFTLPGAGLSGGNIVTQRAGHYYVAPATASPTYDADGNLTSDSRWTYTWDGENRLIAMETTSAALSASVPKRRLEFLYDGQSRRISKKVMDWHAATSAWITKDERRFVYDGWNLVAEVDTSGNLIQSHTWGMDLSGTAQGAGGVGGLLWSNDVANTQILFAAYDGNGNVVAMISTSDSKVKARYDYNAFGETVLQEGDGTASSNPYRFSTKYEDAETSLYYYGFRYYQPTTGWWLNRDPIGELGGSNIYNFAANDSINNFDILGFYVSSLTANPQNAALTAQLLGETAKVGIGAAISTATVDNIAKKLKPKPKPKPNLYPPIPDEEPEDETKNGMRLQLQTGKQTPWSSAQHATAKRGVTAVQLKAALLVMNMVGGAQEFPRRCRDILNRSTDKMNKKIDGIVAGGGIAKGGNVTRVEFCCPDRSEWRIDLENLAGHNLRFVQ